MLKVVFLITVTAAIFSLTAFSDYDFFLLDLGAHFRMQYLCLGAVSLGIFLSRRKTAFACLAAVCVAANVIAIFPYYCAAPSASATTKPYRMLLTNVRTVNRNYGGVLDVVRREQPAVAVFLEVDEAWAARLDALSDLYPHRAVMPRSDNFGLAVFTRDKPVSDRRGPFAQGQPPSIIVELERDGRMLHVVATHPVPPMDPRMHDLRNAQLASIAEQINALHGDVAVLGDLNVTMWSPHFRRLLIRANLEDARRGFGILPTWPADNPLLSIPIDHCLLRGGLRVANLRTFSTNGSDHFGLIADLS